MSLIDDIANSLAMSYGSHAFALKGGTDYKAAESVVNYLYYTVFEEIRNLHAISPVYLYADACPGHYDEGHDGFEVSVGEFVCTSTPPEYYICGHCSEYSEEDVEYPCETMQILEKYGMGELNGRVQE